MSKPSWPTVGKFLVGAIAAIGGLIGIYAWYRIKEPNVSASGNCYDFSLSESFYSQVTQLSTIPETTQIDELLPKTLENRYEVAIKIHDLITQNKNVNLVRDMKEVNQLCSFVVSNSGEKEAKDVKLDFDFRGVFQIEKSGEATKSEAFNGAIALGNLHPGGHFTITVWSNRLFGYTPGWKTIYISHSEGVSEVMMTKPWYQQSLSTVFFNSFGFFMGVIVILWLVFWLGRISRAHIVFGDIESQQRKIESEIIIENPDKVTNPQDAAPPSPS